MLPDLSGAAKEEPMKTETQPSTGFDNREAAKQWSRDLQTITGFNFHVRPARPADQAALGSFFEQLSTDDIYFRFLSAYPRVDEWRLKALTRIDDPHTIDFLAFPIDDDRQVLASAMLAADEDFKMAEFALATRSDMKHRGISWTLLDHVARYASSRGLEKLHAVHCSRDYAATSLEREAGFRVRASADDPALLIAEKILHPESAHQI